MAPGPRPQLESVTKSQEEHDANNYVNDLIDRASASAMDQEEEEEEEDCM